MGFDRRGWADDNGAMNHGRGVVLPGQGGGVGVLGSGQLGRMFAIAARRMGYRVRTYSPDTDTPTGMVADVEVVGAYEDLDRVREFARGAEVVTFEFENVPFAAAEACAEVVPVRPAGKVLHTTQHRLREKTFLRDSGFPVVPFEKVTSEAELVAALGRLGTPAVLKTAGWGYDGKGQVKIAAVSEAAAAWKKLGTTEAVLEAWVPFVAEASVVCARGVDGGYTDWGLIENVHVNHILDVSVSPARLGDKVRKEACEVARAVCEAIDVVGVLCVEFFVTKGGVLINELAPRPHNSGHLTFDACVTSQFEQQLRAVCGLPLGDTKQMTPGSAMAQLLGDMWPPRGEPDWAAALQFPGVKLHLYGKHDPRPGRKMGHLTAVGGSPDEALKAVLAARSALTRK